MELTILGCMGGYPTKDVGTTAYLLTSDDFRLLIDVGSNALLSLEHHLDPLDLDALILTHYHADHIADLGVLQYTFQLKEPAEGKAKKVLPIYGHTESEFFRLLEMTGVSEGIAYAPDETLELGPFRIRFLKTIHPVPCYALRIEEIATGKVFVFGADSAYLPAFVPFVKDADLFMADANLFNGNERHHAHMTAGEVAAIAEEAAVKQLILTHLPQKGELSVLLGQAKEAAPSVSVTLAEKDRIVTI
ncbi:MBL fold metallo-hydrolase [Trichococcus shcherbakoviae]|uniref:MBL fold metallo-hydrolase n=1 Tax=Trichococcus shcherbakoviae subsp. psychrophilus TaxID=2585775 RepID=A0A5C5E8H2_9LACT|nr:MBL fold metallo-hydrolase [Trichococcus shcherbakoviae]TNV69439.1 MBL fold metallo-hydrolase [Trichococcus shcherbakoviae subsp. psychrophilus]